MSELVLNELVKPKCELYSSTVTLDDEYEWESTVNNVK